MSNKYKNPNRPPEPIKKECAKQAELDRKAFDLKIFNFLKDNLSVTINPFRDDEHEPTKYEVKLWLRNPISGEDEEIDKDFT